MSSLTSVVLVKNKAPLSLSKQKFNFFTYISECGNWQILVPNLLGKSLVAFGQKLSAELTDAVFVLEWHDYAWKALLFQGGDELACINLDKERPKRSKVQSVEAMRDFTVDEAAFEDFLHLVERDVSQIGTFDLEQGIKQMLISEDLTEVNYESLWLWNDLEIEAKKLVHIANKKVLDLEHIIVTSFRSIIEEELGFGSICENDTYKFNFYYVKREAEQRYTFRIDGYHKGEITCYIEGPHGYKLLSRIHYKNERDLRDQLSNYLSGSNRDAIDRVLNFKVERFQPEVTYSTIVDPALHELGFVRSHTDEDLLRMLSTVEYKQVHGNDVISFLYTQMLIKVVIINNKEKMIQSEILETTSFTPQKLFTEFTNESEFQAVMVEMLQMIKVFYDLSPAVD